jgi:hypothetical protein
VSVTVDLNSNSDEKPANPHLGYGYGAGRRKLTSRARFLIVQNNKKMQNNRDGQS